MRASHLAAVALIALVGCSTAGSDDTTTAGSPPPTVDLPPDVERDIRALGGEVCASIESDGVAQAMTVAAVTAQNLDDVDLEAAAYAIYTAVELECPEHLAAVDAWAHDQ